MPNTDTTTSTTAAQETAQLTREIERLSGNEIRLKADLVRRETRIQELEAYINKHDWVNFLRGTFLLFWLVGVITAFTLPTWMVVCRHANPWVLLFYIPAVCFGGMFWETTTIR